jgi:uncharacterized protein
MKAKARIRVLEVLIEEEAYSDVIREAQEAVELALKGVLRQVGIEPPHWHDVGPLLNEYRDRFPVDVRNEIPRLMEISAWLRKEREFAFYGDIDFIPTERYSHADALVALDDARLVVSFAELVIK